MAGDSPTQHPEESSPDRQTVASVARQGTVLGQCLGEALASLQQQDEESSPSAKRRKVQLDTSAVNRILQTFGEAVADTSTGEDSKNPAPAALLSGRLDHYNRVGQNWRIVLDDIKLQSRLPLDRNRRRSDHHSLWKVDSVEQNEISIPGKAQILAFDDL
jgi:hypothetical protein